MKTVIDSLNSASYFRKAKPVLSSFVNKLRFEGQVIAEEELLLEGFSLLPDEHVVKLMFYYDTNQLLQLMIGTGPLDQSDSDS